MKVALSMISLLVCLLAGCATGGDIVQTGRGTVDMKCADGCIERTGNAALCNKFLNEGRASCGDLTAKVCAAAPEQCGTKAKSGGAL